MHYWWVSASEHSEGGWHWNRFFGNPRRGGRWGGPEWIRSPLSHKHIRRMRRGDIVVAYQAREGIAGLAVLASDGYQSSTGADFDIFDLAARPIIAVKQRIPLDAVRNLPHSKQSFQFVRVLRGTVFEVRSDGFGRLLGLLLAYNPGQARQMSSFISKAKVPVPYRVLPRQRRAD